MSDNFLNTLTVSQQTIVDEEKIVTPATYDTNGVELTPAVTTIEKVTYPANITSSVLGIGRDFDITISIDGTTISSPPINL